MEVTDECIFACYGIFFSAMCYFVLSWSFNKLSSLLSSDDVSPFVLIGSTHNPVVGSLLLVPSQVGTCELLLR